MKKHPTATGPRLYSPRATLCAIGIKLRALKFFDTIAEHVHVRQKTVKHTPVEKLTDAFIAILAGAHGLSEINTRVRADAALQRSFGRNSCAEQSVVQETLDACTAENVRQMKHACKALMRSHGRAYRHPYKAGLQLLDVDMTGLPCGHRAERASKGYFANRPGRYGRQMARVVATHYEEIIMDWVGPGNVQLNRCLRPLIAAASMMSTGCSSAATRSTARTSQRSGRAASRRRSGSGTTTRCTLAAGSGGRPAPPTATSGRCGASSCGGASATGGSASRHFSRR